MGVFQPAFTMDNGKKVWHKSKNLYLGWMMFLVMSLFGCGREPDRPLGNIGSRYPELNKGMDVAEAKNILGEPTLYGETWTARGDFKTFKTGNTMGIWKGSDFWISIVFTKDKAIGLEKIMPPPWPNDHMKGWNEFLK